MRDMAHTNPRRSSAGDVAVVMVPLPAQGHLNQLLHLSLRISAFGIPVHYAGSATHLRQVQNRVQSTTAAVHFHELPVPHFESPPPNPRGPTRFPSQIIPSLTASLHLGAPLFSLVTSLSSAFRRVAVVYDSLMAYVVQDLPSIRGVECFIFRSISALAAAAWEDGVLPQLPIHPEILKKVPSMEGYYPPAFGQFLATQLEAPKVFSGEIYNSCREIEGFALDTLETRMRREGKRIFAVGPFSLVSGHRNEMRPAGSRRHWCLEWLDNQAAGSVVLVAFGTTCSFTEEQLREVARGLERSGQSFVWVQREADRADVFSDAGGASGSNGGEEGFNEGVWGRGIVVKDWVPQLQILGHPSTGGFVTHCGWNSCLESMSMGVPMATWAQHSDQPANSVLITKILKTGLEIKSWSPEEELVPWNRIEKVVRKLINSSGLRKRAEEVAAALRTSVGEGGTSGREMESFITYITRKGS